MLDTNLILVEGLIGAGKTWTTEYLGEEINKTGIKTAWYLELDTDSPIDTLPTKLLNANYEKKFDLEQALAGDGPDNPTVYTLPQWKKLAESLNGSNEIIILDSRFWQHSAMYLFLRGISEEEVTVLHLEIVEALAKVRPFLVYLTQEDIEGALARIFQERTPEWTKWMIWLFEEQRYLKTRNLKGAAGVVKFYQAWSTIADKLYELHPYPKVKLLNPHDDWPAAYRKLHAALGLAPYEAPAGS